MTLKCLNWRLWQSSLYKNLNASFLSVNCMLNGKEMCEKQSQTAAYNILRRVNFEQKERNSNGSFATTTQRTMWF